MSSDQFIAPLRLPRLAAYASFLLRDHLNTYADTYREVFAAQQLTTHSFLSGDYPIADEARFRRQAIIHLQLLADNRPDEQIALKLQYLQRPDMDTIRDIQVKSATVFRLSYINKTVFCKLLHLFTTDIREIMELVAEIDEYMLALEKAANELSLDNLEQLLNQKEAQLLEAQHLSGTGSYIWDVKQGRAQATPELLHMLNIRSSEEVQDHLLQIYPEDQEKVKQTFIEALRTQSSFVLSYRFDNGQGERVILTKGKVVQGAEGALIKGTVMDITDSEHLVQRLEESRTLYREAQELTRMGNWRWDVATDRITWSDEVYHICELDALIDRCRLEGVPYTYQCCIHTTDGAIKMLRVRGEAVRDSTGRIHQVAGTIQDITKEHHLLQQLQRSEVLYKQAQSIGRIGNWVYDVATHRMEWSDELYHIFEVVRDDPAAQELATQKILAPDNELLTAHFKRCVEQGVAYDCHYRVRMDDGQIRHFRSKGEVAPATADMSLQIIGTVQDVTEQLAVERQLRDNQKFTQKIADLAPSVIAVYNIHTGKYAFISMAIETLLGYSRNEIMEKGVAFFMEIMHPDDLALIVEQNNTALQQANAHYVKDMPEEVAEFKYRMRHKDGTYRWFQTFGTVFDRDEQGQVQQVLNISMDISGEKQAELALNHKNMLLQQSNSSLEEFAYIASHDLQEPLRKISTFGNMLETLQEEHLTASGKLYLRKIIDSSLRMQQMISDLLSVSVVSGNRSFALENLQQLLDEVLVTLEYKIEETHARVEVAIPLPEARVVASQFRQLFQNLISNSLKFARKQVAPVIRIHYAYITGEDAYQLHLDQDKQYLRLVFEDNGIGFSNTYAGKIFAIFQRLHGKSEYEGTGIGLAVCKKIVEHHNGIIYASGEPDNGAVFTIIIPV